MNAAPSALLVSIHDVSPLSLQASKDVVHMATEHGVPLRALTVLVIPQHEGGPALDTDMATCRWLHRLADAGACLCLHGLTHRMTGRVGNPWQWLWAYAFARGQGELYTCDRGDCERRLEDARRILDRSGLGERMTGFVPPAWLLSPAAGKVVAEAGFLFHERLSGISVVDMLLARRLIGFGSLSSVESHLSSVYAWLLSHARPTDTRLALHPVDGQRPSTRRAVVRTLKRMVGRTTPMNYVEFLAARAAVSARHDETPRR